MKIYGDICYHMILRYYWDIWYMMLSINHTFLTLHSCLRMLFTFEAFSLSLSDLGAIPDIKTLFSSVFQVIAKLRIPIVISSGVSIVLICLFLYVGWYHQGFARLLECVKFHVLSFCTAKMFYHNFASTAWPFPALNVRYHRIFKYDDNWELPLFRCIAFSFIVRILYVLSSCINYILFCSIFTSGESVLVFSFSVGHSSVSNCDVLFLLLELL